VQTGQGMLATINIAAERNGYTMTDRGTYIKYADTMKGNPPLKVLVEQDKILLNQYSVLAINPQALPEGQNRPGHRLFGLAGRGRSPGTDPGFQTAGQSRFSYPTRNDVKDRLNGSRLSLAGSKLKRGKQPPFRRDQRCF
jgi:ABC-type tungstate transport system permease subunit